MHGVAEEDAVAKVWPPVNIKATPKKGSFAFMFFVS
jgi:hypothetical protein